MRYLSIYPDELQRAEKLQIQHNGKWKELSVILSTDEKIKKAISNVDKKAQKEIEKMLNEAAQTSFDAEAAIYHAANKTYQKPCGLQRTGNAD